MTLRERLQAKYRALQTQLAEQSDWLDEIENQFAPLEETMPNAPETAQLRQEIEDHRKFHAELTGRLASFVRLMTNPAFDE